MISQIDFQIKAKYCNFSHSLAKGISSKVVIDFRI